MKTVQELNEIHREWMALDPFAPKPEINRVLDMMKHSPSAFINCAADKDTGIVHVGSQPQSASPWPIENCIAFAAKLNIRTDIAWCGSKGEWVNL